MRIPRLPSSFLTLPRLAFLALPLSLAACADHSADIDPEEEQAELVGVSTTDAGTGVDTACNATSPRTERVDVVVTPDDGDARILSMIAAAQSSIEITIYQFSSRPIIDAIKAAKQTRGVTVRVIQDRQEARPAIVTELRNAGIEVKLSSTDFTFTHQKTITIDKEETLVFSGNLDRNGFNGGRNYGIVDDDPADVADFNELFEADWNDRAPNLACTRLVISPNNSRARILALIDTARRNLDIEAMYVSDNEVEDHIVAAHNRGVSVRVLFNDPAHGVGDATRTARRLIAKGIPVKKSGAMFIHAKLIIRDNYRAFVGSENFSANSLDRNREAGVMVSRRETNLSRITSAFESDWSATPAF